jgi:hypothetical protein
VNIRSLANQALLLTNADDFGSGRSAAAVNLSLRSRTPIRYAPKRMAVAMSILKEDDLIDA